MKKIIFLLLTIMLMSTTVSALWVQNSRNETVTCRDYSDKDFHEYQINYYTYDVGGEPYYKMEETSDSPFTYEDMYGYIEYPANLNENGVWVVNQEKVSASRKVFYDENLAKLQPKADVPIYVRHMGWVPFSPENAAAKLADEQNFIEYFKYDANCIPCDKRESKAHLFESYGECISCKGYRKGYQYVWNVTQGYCVPCQADEIAVLDECVLCEGKIIDGQCIKEDDSVNDEDSESKGDTNDDQNRETGENEAGNDDDTDSDDGSNEKENGIDDNQGSGSNTGEDGQAGEDNADDIDDQGDNDENNDMGGIIECSFEELYKTVLSWFGGHSRLSNKCQKRADYEKSLSDEYENLDEKEKAELDNIGWKIVSSKGLSESTVKCDNNLECSRKGHQGAECKSGYCMKQE
ncbi:hypothetical protein K9M79_07015 [Candidatus Woesearchaeota archaeon]|nr:hypothetical protein [Candidatus Woesearchaeota archaeon]